MKKFDVTALGELLIDFTDNGKSAQGNTPVSYTHLDVYKRQGKDGKVDQKKKNEILLGQVEELVTVYGPLAEIWFDGGILRPEKGGPDIPGLLARIAPDLICFGGCPGIKNVLRWSGSEQGVAVPECWSAAHFLTDPERNLSLIHI